MFKAVSIEQFCFCLSINKKCNKHPLLILAWNILYWLVHDRILIMGFWNHHISKLGSFLETTKFHPGQLVTASLASQPDYRLTETENSVMGSLNTIPSGGAWKPCCWCFRNSKQPALIHETLWKMANSPNLNWWSPDFWTSNSIILWQLDWILWVRERCIHGGTWGPYK